MVIFYIFFGFVVSIVLFTIWLIYMTWDYIPENDDNDSDRINSDSREYRDRITYQLQVRGGTTWLNVGGPRNEDGAMRSADYEKSRNPNKRYRVVELRNGRVAGTVYSC